MRILLPVFWAATLCAQTAPPSPPPSIPWAMRGVYQLINDFGNTARYAADNQKVAAVPEANRVVFMGDSITDGWGRGNNGSVFFPGKPYVNRGISGQTTAQMLLRFYPDVVALKPKAVVILAGTNDIGGNTGPVTMESIEQNLAAMADISRANHIRVVLSSVLPVCDYHQPQTGSRPPEKILQLNRWMKEFAAGHNLVYLDYFAATVDDKGFLKADITGDGLHPNAAGYAIMGPLAERAIAQALGNEALGK
jgi:lysophospholipase L1-like esterase